MSDSDNESETEFEDFSASEDEYIPTDADSYNDESDDETDEEEDVRDSTSLMKPKTKVQQKRPSRKNIENEDDSDSSVENYLVNPNEIDLASDFFDPNKIVETVVPQFDCNVGLSLSDSDDSEEVFQPVPSTSQASAVKVLDFDAHNNFHKHLENAKEQLQNFKSNNFGQEENGDVDVSKLLAIGEPSVVVKKSSQSKRKPVLNSSDESDFEEVEEDVKTEKKSDLEVRIGPAIKQKPNKHQAELEASIKRKINRRLKENQLMMHKVHLLSWIAYGNFVNKILNSTNLMEMVVKYIPSEKSYPKDQTDLKYFEQISKWYKTTVGLKTKEQNCNLKCLPPIATSLALQIQSKMAICKKDFVFIFIILLRSMGIQCRMVINLATIPIRPAAKDLCVISTKTTEDPKSSDKTKTEKKTATKKEKESNSDKNDGNSIESSKSKKSKTQSKSISGKITKISAKSPETSTKTKSLRSQRTLKSTADSSTLDPIDDKRKNLKRSVSVQSISSVNDNNKRRHIENAPKTGSSTLNGNTSTTRKVSTLSSNNQKSEQPTKTKPVKVIVSPPISLRTRRGCTGSASASSQNIPQLDGGNDKKSKKRKIDLYKIKLPLRSRSVSPSTLSNHTTLRSKSVAIVSPQRGRDKSNMARIRLPSTSRSKSKSPSSFTSDRNSRKSKFEETKSDATLASSSKFEKPSTEVKKKSAEKPMTLKSSSKSPNPTTSKAAIRNPSLSPLKRAKESLATEAEHKQNKNLKSKSSNPSTSKAADPQSKSVSLKGTSDPAEKLSVETKPKKDAKKYASNPSTSKAANEDSKLSTSRRPADSDQIFPSKTMKDSKSMSKDASAISPTKVAATSEKSDAKTKSSSRAVASSSLNPTESSKLVAASTSKKPIENVEKPTKKTLKRKPTQSVSSDSDFLPTPKKKFSSEVAKPLPKQVERLKKRIDRRILSTDDESVEPSVKKDDMNYWIEVYCEAESKWMCIDLFKLKVNCVDELKKKATKPIAYVFAWNNNNKIKDVSPRYCSQWNTTTRKLRVQSDWLDEAFTRYKEPLSQRCVSEDRELEEIHSQTPIPTSISELKDHPLYVLPRHLLKFQGIYPPNPIPVGFIRDEPIYPRLCVHTLHSREIWVKQARVVNPGEEPYKIVKARPKWDRLANKMLEPQPLEIFGRWQTGPYVPPTAEDGIVPRNAYGNVELFKPEMLPKKTVHLRLAGLNRVCAKLKIDCAQAVVGFDFHGGSSHPTFDGFIVCEEFAELVTERWCEEQEEAYRKSKEKQNQRIYENWKKLIKGLLIRQRLQRKYNFKGLSTATPEKD